MSIDVTRWDISSKIENVTLELEDEISFEDFFQELREDQCSPDHNASLKNRIRNVVSENGHLRQELDETKEDLENCRKNCQEEISRSEKMRGSLEQTVTELSGECKRLTLELETVRTECAILEDKMAANDPEIAEYRTKMAANETEIAAYKAKMAADEVKIAADEIRFAEIVANDKTMGKNIVFKDVSTLTEYEMKNIPDDSSKDDQVKILREKLAQTNARLYEMKNSCTHLRQELNKAQKLLWSEIGEGVTIASLSNQGNNGGWRGRAEQIRQLRHKISDLQGKLGEYEKSSKSSSSLPGSTSTEERNLSYLRNLEKERRQSMENCTRELRQAEIGLETREKKLQAAKARIKMLENDLANAKTSLTLLNEKRIHDDRLIEALNGQLGAVEEKFRERERISRNEKSKADETCKELRNELATVNTRIELLRKRIQEKETEIDEMRKGHRVDTSARPEIGPSGSSSVTRKLENERKSMTKEINSNEYVTMSLAAEAEGRRLVELVAILNERLDNERKNIDRVNELLRHERRKSARLESKLQRLEKERVGIAPKFDAGYGTSRSTRCNACINTTTEQTNSEKIRFKVELLEEECLALKARLSNVEREKSADLAFYKRMLEETRQTFRDALREKM